MFEYNLALTINDSKEVLSNCRIDNENRLFTKNRTVNVDVGDKLSLKRADGFTANYVVIETPHKINLMGSREFRISQI